MQPRRVGLTAEATTWSMVFCMELKKAMMKLRGSVPRDTVDKKLTCKPKVTLFLFKNSHSTRKNSISLFKNPPFNPKTRHFLLEKYTIKNHHFSLKEKEKTFNPENMHFLFENPRFKLKAMHFYHKNPPFNQKSCIFSSKPPFNLIKMQFLFGNLPFNPKIIYFPLKNTPFNPNNTHFLLRIPH